MNGNAIDVHGHCVPQAFLDEVVRRKPFGVHAELGIDQDTKLVGEHLARERVQRATRQVPEYLRTRGDGACVVGHPLVGVGDVLLEAVRIEVRDPGGEIAARGAVEEEVAEEAHAQALAAGPLRARPEEVGQLRLEDAAMELAVAALQVAVVAALVREVEVGPARLAQRRLGTREAEAARGRPVDDRRGAVPASVGGSRATTSGFSAPVLLAAR